MSGIPVRHQVVRPDCGAYDVDPPRQPRQESKCDKSQQLVFYVPRMTPTAPRLLWPTVPTAQARIKVDEVTDGPAVQAAL